MTDETELKPCPFCGGEAYFRTPQHDRGSAFEIMMVECKRCGASPYAIQVYACENEENKRAAIARLWNRRTNNDKP